MSALLRLSYAIQRAHCLGCERLILPWQGRCHSYHTACKHRADATIAERNGIARWACGACGK